MGDDSTQKYNSARPERSGVPGWDRDEGGSMNQTDSDRPAFGIAHLTTVPTNYDEVDPHD